MCVYIDDEETIYTFHGTLTVSRGLAYNARVRRNDEQEEREIEREISYKSKRPRQKKISKFRKMVKKSRNPFYMYDETYSTSPANYCRNISRDRLEKLI